MIFFYLENSEKENNEEAEKVKIQVIDSIGKPENSRTPLLKDKGKDTDTEDLTSDKPESSNASFTLPIDLTKRTSSISLAEQDL